jgi:SMODS-associated and fused to various effectors sensor domain
MRAGGRCEYPACNKPLWRDDLTLAKMNGAYLAHIVGDSADGPRGDSILSAQLKADPSNIMLLCDIHHRLVDQTDVASHTVNVLRHYKQEHEERIEQQTGVQTHLRTHIVLLSCRIGDRQGLVDYEQARQAVFPHRYPADEHGIRVDVSSLQLSERDEGFWNIVCQQIDRQLNRYLNDHTGPSGKPINHLSIFAFAPIAALIYLGKRLGDTIPMDVYQRHRNTDDWRWQDLSDDAFEYIGSHLAAARQGETRIAVNLSLSDTIHQAPIEAALGGSVPIYTLTIHQPRRDYLRAQEQLELFREAWRHLLGEIRSRHNTVYTIHLFPAVPNSVAVEIGRLLLPKSDPSIVIWDWDSERGGFVRTIEV